jgi:hypothetical protein
VVIQQANFKNYLIAKKIALNRIISDNRKFILSKTEIDLFNKNEKGKNVRITLIQSEIA